MLSGLKTQGLLLKIFFLALCYVVVGPAWGSPALPDPQHLTRRADSLFRAGQAADAGLLYEAALREGQPLTDALLLKLAYVQEQEGNVARQLYYLQTYFERHPDDTVQRQMADLARQHGLSGYETDDLNYFLLTYRQNGKYILALLLLLGVYYVWSLWRQYRQGPRPSVRQRWTVLLFLLVLLVFVNLPAGYQSGIISRADTALRTDPSAAAPVAEFVGPGHKLNVLSRKDVWLRVFFRNRLYYVRQDAVWVI